MTENNHQTKEHLLRLREILKRTGLSRSSLYEQVSEGKFPEPVKISSRSVAWVESEVDSWIDPRINACRSERI